MNLPYIYCLLVCFFFKSVDWKAADAYLEVDRSVAEVDWLTPGTSHGHLELANFCLKRLKIFGDKRNDPNVKALSSLSPWLHFGILSSWISSSASINPQIFWLSTGQISAQRCILEVKAFKAKYAKGVDAYIEEACIRRELSDNFCFYNSNYDSVTGITITFVDFNPSKYLRILFFVGAANWAQETLAVHK